MATDNMVWSLTRDGITGRLDWKDLEAEWFGAFREEHQLEK